MHKDGANHPVAPIAAARTFAVVARPAAIARPIVAPLATVAHAPVATVSHAPIAAVAAAPIAAPAALIHTSFAAPHATYSF